MKICTWYITFHAYYNNYYFPSLGNSTLVMKACQLIEFPFRQIEIKMSSSVHIKFLSYLNVRLLLTVLALGFLHLGFQNFILRDSLEKEKLKTQKFKLEVNFVASTYLSNSLQSKLSMKNDIIHVNSLFSSNVH